MAPTQVGEAEAALEQGLAVTVHRVVGVDEAAPAVHREQDTGLLETLPYGGQHVVGPALVQAHDLTDLGVVRAQGMGSPPGLVFVHGAAGKYEVTGQECGVPAALQ